MKESVMVSTLLDPALFHAALGEDGGLFCNKDTGGGHKMPVSECSNTFEY